MALPGRFLQGPQIFLFFFVRIAAPRASYKWNALQEVMNLDKDFFVQAMDAHSGALFRVACTILGSCPDDCRDAMQETALKAWEKRHTLREEGKFKSWIIRILVNECRNILRSRRRLVPLEKLPEQSVSPPDPALFLALQSLPEKFRLPLMLQYAEGMTYREIAAALRLTEAAVRGRIHRAKEQLRKELEA